MKQSLELIAEHIHYILALAKGEGSSTSLDKSGSLSEHFIPIASFIMRKDTPERRELKLPETLPEAEVAGLLALTLLATSQKKEDIQTLFLLQSQLIATIDDDKKYDLYLRTCALIFMLEQEDHCHDKLFQNLRCQMIFFEHPSHSIVNPIYQRPELKEIEEAIHNKKGLNERAIEKFAKKLKIATDKQEVLDFLQLYLSKINFIDKNEFEYYLRTAFIEKNGHIQVSDRIEIISKIIELGYHAKFFKRYNYNKVKFLFSLFKKFHAEILDSEDLNNKDTYLEILNLVMENFLKMPIANLSSSEKRDFERLKENVMLSKITYICAILITNKNIVKLEKKLDETTDLSHDQIIYLVKLLLYRSTKDNYSEEQYQQLFNKLLIGLLKYTEGFDRVFNEIQRNSSEQISSAAFLALKKLFIQRAENPAFLDQPATKYLKKPLKLAADYKRYRNYSAVGLTCGVIGIAIASVMLIFFFLPALIVGSSAIFFSVITLISLVYTMHQQSKYSQQYKFIQEAIEINYQLIAPNLNKLELLVKGTLIEANTAERSSYKPVLQHPIEAYETKKPSSPDINTSQPINKTG